jgi:hypothetical protein
MHIIAPFRSLKQWVYLGLALAPELFLLLFAELLVDLCALAGLVAMCTSRQSRVLTSALLID